MATIKDVATKAGVSVATVSYVLNDSRGTRPETRERVQAAVRELGYVHNAAARQLAAGRSNMLGLVVPEITNPFFPEVILGFQDQALLHDIDTLVMNTNSDAQRVRTCVDRLLALRVPGIAIISSSIDPSVIARLAEKEVAGVYFDIGRVDRWIQNIVIDFESGIAEALEHLKELGHERIGFIGGPQHFRSHQRRKRAFLESSQKSGQLVGRIVESDLTVQGGYFACSKLLADFAPTAVFAANDLMGIGAMHCAHDKGIPVPSELSVVGTDDISLAQYMNPALTTVAVPRNKMGAVAFQAVWELVSGSAETGSEHIVETSLIVRQSSGAVTQRAASRRAGVQTGMTKRSPARRSVRVDAPSTRLNTFSKTPFGPEA